MDISKQTPLAILALLVVGSLVLVPRSTQAQNQPGALYVGLQGGISQSSFTGDGVSSNSRQGLTGGIHFMYNINEALSVEFDFLYTERGANSITAQGGPDVSDAYDLAGDRMTIDYYDFPVLFKLTAPIEAVKVRAFVGPSISFLAGATENGNTVQKDLQSEVPVTDRFLLYDLGGVVGGEIAVPLPGVANGELAVDGRYTIGYSNVDQTQDFTLKNRSLSGSLVFRYKFR
ncbi:MAG: porin family protein [Salinibacter sp.]